MDRTWLHNPVLTSASGLPQALWETIYMASVTMVFTVLVGLPLGMLLHATSKGGLVPIRWLSTVLGAVVNIGRSLPFIILMIALIPFTRLLVSQSVGSTAAIVPLTIGAIPFFARLVEINLREVDSGKVEAAAMMGASRSHLMGRVLLPEALPGIIGSVTTTAITVISYTAMAGAVGGGGLGAMAIQYGYNRFMADVMIVTVVLLVVMVQIVQVVGDILARAVDHR
ncbi:methionine ABC transporter permease [Devriesea agamarum]|uniref:methionine ABC transporter permease n=1 Tax=Devriesea agamarum TaxID=472569 RepID=UPI00071DC6BE|nr:methionine ABC transporter permease [Devriesea agamarum]